jgi:hypothetical protein
MKSDDVCEMRRSVYGWDYDGYLIYIFEVENVELDESDQKLLLKTSFSKDFSTSNGICYSLKEAILNVEHWFKKNSIVVKNVPIIYYPLVGTAYEAKTFSNVPIE